MKLFLRKLSVIYWIDIIMFVCIRCFMNNLLSKSIVVYSNEFLKWLFRIIPENCWVKENVTFAGLLYVLVRALQHKDSKYNCLLINGLTALVGWRFWWGYCYIVKHMSICLSEFYSWLTQTRTYTSWNVKWKYLLKLKNNLKFV